METVVLVDENDVAINAMEKIEAHQKGLLHRAFSIFVFNTKGELLLQQRALTKYHSGGLWTNTCCSHPRWGEEIENAAKRRLKEEMGIELTLTKVFDFIYEATFSNGLTEHEFDHVFVGYSDIKPDINVNEVANYAYRNMEAIKQVIETNSEFYTEWFVIAFPKIYDWWKKKKLS
ncbi:MAG: isopentenyl-diphosphate Delta-isomerase [Bacteroidetes bacterium]|nr:isopentenyl-diphosphate Delta-isomerase [Bacteroidota bacterium]MBS1649242.1 isopentenyl-diphosphate Delta-isomerase [Bacteroidota bacterium]